jgi:hypothetical protein
VKTLFACETPWFDSHGTFVAYSMEPFLCGLARLHGFRLLYRTFTTIDELRNLLGYEFPSENKMGNVLYVASHGNGGRISAGREGMNLSKIGDSVHRSTEGVWISACNVAGADPLLAFVTGARAKWVGGYTKTVGWTEAMLVDLAIIDAVMSSRRVSASGIIVQFARALRPFNPMWSLDRDNDEPLWASIRLAVRSKGDVTNDLRKKMNWPSQK